MSVIDLDAIVDQRREAVGSENIEFQFKGEQFSIPHPLFVDDEFKDDLAIVNNDVDLAIAYLGEEQYDKFREMGGKSGFIGMLLQKVAKDARDEDEDGNPTRSRRSSGVTRKRPKRR